MNTTVRINLDPNTDREPDAKELQGISFQDMVNRIKGLVKAHQWDHFETEATGEVVATIQVWKTFENEIALHVDGDVYYIACMDD